MLDVSLESRELPLWQILGPDAPVLIEAENILFPEVMNAISTEQGFIARLGFDDFLIQAEELILSEKMLCWVYPRADRIVALQGEHWREVMAQVCHQDFSNVGKDHWLMVSAAGINIWCLGLSDGLLMGCDPSLGNYFSETLNEIICEINEKVSSEKG